MRYDAALGVHILDTEETRVLMDRAFLKVLGPEWRQANGAPPSWIPDSAALIMADLSTALDKALETTADPR